MDEHEAVYVVTTGSFHGGREVGRTTDAAEAWRLADRWAGEPLPGEVRKAAAALHDATSLPPGEPDYLLAEEGYESPEPEPAGVGAALTRVRAWGSVERRPAALLHEYFRRQGDS